MSDDAAGAPAPSGASAPSGGPPKTNQNAAKKAAAAAAAPPPEYNARWGGYTAIALMSLINFCAVSNIAASFKITGHPGVALTWGVLSFTFAVLVLASDRSQLFVETIDYTKAGDGNFEGYSLLVLTAYWIAGVGFITQVDGVGYLTLNIYFSTWLCLFASVYTLNEWSASKDILSISELTGLSATLKSWYVLFLSSLVVFGTSINALAKIDQRQSDATLGIVVSFVSVIMALMWICIHYRFFTSNSSNGDNPESYLSFVEHGGWIELGSAAVLVVLWIAVTAVITQDQGLGSTIVGVRCDYEVIYSVGGSPQGGPLMTKQLEEEITNCTVEVLSENATNVSSCSDVLGIPGSNLYVFVWLCLGSTLHVCFRWKAQQAIQFAQARQNKQQRTTAAADPTQREQLGDDDDDDDDLDEFVDAAY